MACVELSLTLPAQAGMTIEAAPEASLGLRIVGSAALALGETAPAAMTIAPKDQAALETVLTGASLTLGEVCNINSGTIVVLAGSDGPFRTRDGGYFLLNPAANPPE